ncbi:insulin-like growth factor-binding protein 1 [Choloepus didactylus]|uniref:insulin-like growth factor-binding protein 1 n=1 Tax=Choloepus didactylus TaxID=27675 RepID=UPI00189FA26A|nr:insulin-like growth factor-binding protein 1 [Choloepus didactylus]
MPEFLAARAWPLLLFLGVQLGTSVGASQPWRCAPCSAEKIAQCPPVPASCPEVAPAPGCGCCPTCALQLGAACGVKTERCARGLSCRALPGEPRPLLALTRGQGACVPTTDAAEAEAAHSAEAADVRGSTESGNVFSKSTEMTQQELLDKFHMMCSSSEELLVLWNTVSNNENLKVYQTLDKGPCQRKLYKVLDKLVKAQSNGESIYQFYLPNCNRNGFYHLKQCETSLHGEIGFCWCVYPWNGKKIRRIPKIKGDPKCRQYLNLEN